MNKQDWVWMGHAGHFILGDKCLFRLNTCVGNYIVSTVGELWSDRQVREIHAQVYNPEWLKKNIHLKGDTFDHAYFKEFGFEDIGLLNRKYETMVFKAKKTDDECCPYKIIVSEEVDFNYYNTAEDARKGHMALCEKWSVQ